jgi:hypothetical protein
MSIRTKICASAMGLLLAAGCTKKAAEPTGETTPPGEPSPPAAGSERPTLTNVECEAKGGRVVGDIGDGAIHRPDYVCEGGEKPIASIKAVEGEPVAIEGAVCCPAPA